jgi:hypothetical protein
VEHADVDEVGTTDIPIVGRTPRSRLVIRLKSGVEEVFTVRKVDEVAPEIRAVIR